MEETFQQELIRRINYDPIEGTAVWRETTKHRKTGQPIAVKPYPSARKIQPRVDLHGVQYSVLALLWVYTYGESDQFGQIIGAKGARRIIAIDGDAYNWKISNLYLRPVNVPARDNVRPKSAKTGKSYGRSSKVSFFQPSRERRLCWGGAMEPKTKT